MGIACRLTLGGKVLPQTSTTYASFVVLPCYLSERCSSLFCDAKSKGSYDQEIECEI